MNSKILLVENNVISLRPAFVTDIGSLVGFHLNPADLASKVPKGRKWSAPKDFEWVSDDSVWLYRHLMSNADELRLKKDFPYYVDHGVKPLSFEHPPKFELLWTDSGHSVALYMNGEPWAFIDEASHQGYSKGIIDATSGNPWNHKLFEKIFKGLK